MVINNRINSISPPAVVRQADEDASYINSEYRSACKSRSKMLQHYINIGKRLLEVKERTPHGQWLKWLRDNVEFSQKHVWRFMELAKLVVTSNLNPNNPDHIEQIEEEWKRIQGNKREQSKPTNKHEDNNGYDEEVDNDGEEHHEDAGDYVDFSQENSEGDNDDTHTNDRTVIEGGVTKRKQSLVDPKKPKDQPISEEPPKSGGRLGRRDGETIDIKKWGKMSEEDRSKAIVTKGNSKFVAQSTDSIEWALWSWNPVTGCLHDCPYCYARDIANRMYKQRFKPVLWPGRLSAPSNTKFPASDAKRWMGHKNVFTCSMADLFGRWVPKEWIDAVLDVCANSKKWNFLFLTKFPNRMSEFEFPDNCWVGTTVDCQARVKNAEKSFRKVKAKVKWLSCEPLIEPLRFNDLSAFQWVVIGGASRSTRTPEWNPPIKWVLDLINSATECGVRVYVKTNCRFRQYPGVDEAIRAPKPMKYLPEIG